MDRPQMRRKSSAGLLSFRSPSSTSNPMNSSGTLLNYPAPLTMSGFIPGGGIVQPVPSQQGSDAMRSPDSTGASTVRDWDAQSISESAASHSVASGGAGFSGLDILKDTLNKRIMTLTYLRSAHEGRMYWFNTILLTREGISEAMNAPNMHKRAFRFAVLAMSLANIFDMGPSTDYLKALTSLLNDYDAFQDETLKPKIKKRNIFRTTKPKRLGASDYSTGSYDADSFLLTPTFPFPLDYCQTVISLCDILSETYQKIQKTLGSHPSNSGMNGAPDRSHTPGPYHHLNNAPQPQMFGPLGVITPYPGLTSLWPNGPSFAEGSPEEKLWKLAFNPGGAINLSISQASTTLLAKDLDSVKVIDGKLKKIISTLIKELDALARSGIKAELESLDPLLKNLAMPEHMGDGGDD